MTHNFNCSEDTGYVNVHGKDMKVYICETTGNILIPIDELKEMGIRLFRKSQYSRLLFDDNDFLKDFNLYMISCAQNYMLEKKVAFKENDIIESINKIKKMFASDGGGDANGSTPVHNNLPRNNFKPGFTNQRQSLPRKEQEHNSFGDTNKFRVNNGDVKVTTQLREPSKLTLQNLQKEQLFNKNQFQNRSPTSSEHSFSDRRRSGRDGGPNNFNNDRKKFNQKPLFNSERKPPMLVQVNSGPDHKKNAFQDANLGSLPRQTQFDKPMHSAKPNANNLPRQAQTDKTMHAASMGTLPKQIQFDKPVHHVLVSHIEKDTCAWVQDVENTNALLEIHDKIEEESPKANVITKPTYGKVYLAQDDSDWYRCKLTNVNPMTVFFIDYGNSARVSELKETSSELSKIPCQAVKITFSNAKVKLFEKIEIKILEKLGDGSHVVEVLHEGDDKPETPEPKVFTKKPQPLCQLRDGDRVMVVAHKDGKLAVRTKECHDNLRQIEMVLEKDQTPQLSKVTKDQLVVCDQNKQLRRAVVVGVEGSRVQLELLDYWEKVSTDLSSLRNVNEVLAAEPSTFIVTPVVKGFNADCEGMLDELVKSRAKVSVILSHGGEFDLNLGDELLSENFKPPRPKLAQFQWYKPSFGPGEYMLNHYRNTQNLTFGDCVIFERHLDQLVKAGIEAPEPYEPLVGEVCCGLFMDSWSRCVVLECEGSHYKVKFVDFGNVENLNGKQLKELSDDLKEVPIVGIPCRLTGLPAGRDCEELVKKKLPECETYEIIIKKFVDDVYEIEIPEISKMLKEGN